MKLTPGEQPRWNVVKCSQIDPLFGFFFLFCFLKTPQKDSNLLPIHNTHVFLSTGFPRYFRDVSFLKNSDLQIPKLTLQPFISYFHCNRVCHRFRLKKQNDYFWVKLWPSLNEHCFQRQPWQLCNWLEPKIDLPSANSACPKSVKHSVDVLFPCFWVCPNRE